MIISVVEHDKLNNRVVVRLEAGLGDKKVTKDYTINADKVDFREIRKHIEKELVKEKIIDKNISELKVSERPNRGSLSQQ